MIHITRAVVQC